ncbi:MAG: iron ABC transporter permease [Verrucomicrobiota bacterium]
MSKLIQGRRLWLGWPLLATALVLTPLLTLVYGGLTASSDGWNHLAEHLLWTYTVNSLLVALGVGVSCLILGVSTAWLVAHYEFPGRRWLQVALVLPLALPGYVMALVYANLLDSYGPVQQAFRWLGGYQSASEYWFPQIFSLPGVILVLSLSLFPYVYVICRPVFTWQTQLYRDASHSLGHGGWSTLWRVELPLAYPAIVGGVSLCLFEAMADYGSVAYYGVPTLTVGIYRTWFNLGDLPAAMRLASITLLVAFLLVLLERLARRGRYEGGLNAQPHANRQSLRGARAGLAAAWCALPVFLGGVIPVGMLVAWAVPATHGSSPAGYLAIFGQTLLLAAGSGLVITALALLVLFTNRLVRSRWTATAARICSLGYAVPGTVISVGVLAPLIAVDRWTIAQLNSWLGWETGLLLSGSVAGLVLAYTVRFLGVANYALEGGYARLSRVLDETAFTLGRGPRDLLRRVHLPLLRSSLGAAWLLASIDIFKELPATLVLRPFNFDTVATKTFELALEEQLGPASLYALMLVALGLIPVYLLNSWIEKNHARPAAPS